ncbi:MAG: protein tyrosine phosphatase [Parvularculaceae bacterium]
MVIVCSLAGAVDAYAKHRPARVISIASEEDGVPEFPGLRADRHLRLYVDRESCAASIDQAARDRAAQIVAFLKDSAPGEDILVHCNRGVSRSTAAAYIILCKAAGPGTEVEIAKMLRRAAPFADPCPLLVSYADEILGRGGRMIEAIEDLPPPSAVISAPVVVIAPR